MKYIYMINDQDKTTHFRGIISADDRDEVKKHILNEHGDLFPNGKVFQKRRKDEFVYVNIFELSEIWLSFWTKKIYCQCCNKFLTTKIESENMKANFRFCSEECKVLHDMNSDLQDWQYYKSNLSYIYKITQISTGRCYIGKTVNHFIWRWWQHLTSTKGTKFNEFLRTVDLVDVKFEIVEVLSDFDDDVISQRETYWITKFDSIEKGFNSVIPNKNEALRLTQGGQRK